MSAQVQGVALDQRAYHVRAAYLAAAGQVRRMRLAAHRQLDAVIAGRAPEGSLSPLVAYTREWSGIARACDREGRRLAKLKHGGAR